MQKNGSLEKKKYALLWFENVPPWQSQGGGHWPLLGAKSVKKVRIYSL